MFKISKLILIMSNFNKSDDTVSGESRLIIKITYKSLNMSTHFKKLCSLSLSSYNVQSCQLEELRGRPLGRLGFGDGRVGAHAAHGEHTLG